MLYNLYTYVRTVFTLNYSLTPNKDKIFARHIFCVKMFVYGVIRKKTNFGIVGFFIGVPILISSKKRCKKISEHVRYMY